MRECTFAVMYDGLVHNGRPVLYMLVSQRGKIGHDLVETMNDVKIKRSILNVGVPVREWIVVDDPPVMKCVDF